MTEVLYVLGMGRSGSTVLDRLLGQTPGTVAVGEMLNTWRNGVLEQRRCACGAPFAKCVFWGEVAARTPWALSPETAVLVQRVHERHLDSRRMWSVMTVAARERLLTLLPPGYLRALSELYRVVARVSGTDTVIDSSKHPVFAFLLSQAPGIRVRVVHLVRDPRAVAYSWTRWRIEPGTNPPTFMQRYAPLKTAILWDMTELAARAVSRAVPENLGVVRYEEFIGDPYAAVGRLLPLRTRALAPSELRAASTEPGHAMSGNPMRFNMGPVDIRPDDAWRRGLAPRHRTTVMLTTAPLAHRYGYR